MDTVESGVPDIVGCYNGKVLWDRVQGREEHYPSLQQKNLDDIAPLGESAVRDKREQHETDVTLLLGAQV